MEIEVGKVHEYKSYLDKAFRRAKSKVEYKHIKNRTLTKLEKYHILESIRISSAKDCIISDLDKLLTRFPDYMQLDEFYQQVFACFVYIPKYKKAIGALQFAKKNIQKIGNAAERKMRNCESQAEVVALRNQFLARSESILKQINDQFLFLDEARKQIKEIPKFKTSLATVAIAGFPNVGKSTLLGKITDSQPEVAAYAFTTKGLNIGYLRGEGRKIQMIDTPGTLNRPDKMNRIEKMAYITMTELADLIVYVFDLTDTYSLEVQMQLYEKIKEYDRPMIVYYSKKDLLSKEDLKKKPVEGLSDPEQLKETILTDLPLTNFEEEQKAAAQAKADEANESDEAAEAKE